MGRGRDDNHPTRRGLELLLGTTDGVGGHGRAGLSVFFEKLNRSSTAFKALASIVVICVFFNVLKIYRLQTRDGYLRVRTHAAAQAQWNLFLSQISGRRLLSIFPDITIHSSIPEIPDPLLNNVLAQKGKWDFAPVLREIRASKYDFVIVSADPDLAAGRNFYRGLGLWPDALWQAVKGTLCAILFFSRCGSLVAAKRSKHRGITILDRM